MIDRSLLDGSKLIAAMLSTSYGNVNKWMDLVEIVPDYMPPFPLDDVPSIQVRCLVRSDEPVPGPGTVTGRYTYLRHAGHAGWQCGGYVWDCYGTHWIDVEHALLAVIHAPVPPQLLLSICWETP